jgi:hypothetical protein
LKKYITASCTSSTLTGQPATSTGRGSPARRTADTPQTAPEQLTATVRNSVFRSRSPPLLSTGLTFATDTAHASTTSPETSGRQPTSSATAPANHSPKTAAGPHESGSRRNSDQSRCPGRNRSANRSRPPRASGEKYTAKCGR